MAFLCVFAASAAAQRYSFSDYSHGLNNLNINSMAQDRAGYLWVGTENGLYRYDGVQFKLYGAGAGLNARIIERLFVGEDGTLWAGTTTGIFFERADGHFEEVRPPDGKGHFTQRLGSVFTALGQDRVAAAANENGAYLLRRVGLDQWTAERLPTEGAAVWSVLAGRRSALWYGCDEDLCKMVNGKTRHMGLRLNLPAEHWTNLLRARNGNIWIRGQSHLGEIVAKEHRYIPEDLPASAKQAASYISLTEDAQGRIAAVAGVEFGLLEGGQWRMVTPRNGLPRFDLSTLFIDREGSMWLGVMGHGLSHWVGQDHWEGYTTADGLSNDIVWATMRDHEGRLWVSTQSGLDWIPARTNTAKPWRQGGIETERAFALAEGADGAIWMGSAGRGLVRIDPRTLAGRSWKVPGVYRILTDGKGRMWAATLGGLYMVDTRRADRSPRQVNDPAFAKVREPFTDLTLDAVGNLWAAAEQGLLHLDEGGWHRIKGVPRDANPNLVVVDREGHLWTAGDFSGLMRLAIQNNRVTEVKRFERPLLLSGQAVSLLVDSRGWLWVGQDAGLTVYDGKTWRSFTQDDGLIWNDIDGNGLYEDRDGSMWIGTSGGLSHLLSPQTVSSGPPASLVISEMTFGKSTVTEGAEIPWSRSPLSIAVGSLAFRDERRILVRYRLLGLHSEWEQTDDKIIRYGRLAPGDYRFEAVAVDAYSGAVSKVEAISFTLTPQWWQSWWLKTALALLAGLSLLSLWRWSVHLLVRQKQQLEEAVKRRTEDLEAEKAELLRAREQMRFYAERDGMTGLWNHRVILKRLQQEVDRSRRNGVALSVILVDLDHFKRVNDTYGHPAGDTVLKGVAGIFVGMVRSYDSVGRYGGEEFLLILPGTDGVSARIRAEEMRQKLEAARIVEYQEAFSITGSFGVASAARASAEALIKAADEALYKAKHNGRNRVEMVDMAAESQAV